MKVCPFIKIQGISESLSVGVCALLDFVTVIANSPYPILIFQGVWPLLIESALILLQTVPTHIEVDKLKTRLLENTDGVLAVHEFHVWQVITEYFDKSLILTNHLWAKGISHRI